MINIFCLRLGYFYCEGGYKILYFIRWCASDRTFIFRLLSDGCIK